MLDRSTLNSDSTKEFFLKGSQTKLLSDIKMKIVVQVEFFLSQSIQLDKQLQGRIILSIDNFKT